MPFRRSYRRPVYRRRPYRRTPNVRMTKAIVNRTLRQNQEKKYFDTLISGTISITGTVDKLTPIPQGTTDVTRIGDKIRLLAIKFQAAFTVADTTNLIRLILFQWHPNDNVDAPTLGDILQDTTTIQSFYNHDQGANFSIFYDSIRTLDTNGASSREIRKNISFTKKGYKTKWVKKTIKYLSAGTVGMDQIYALLMSDSSAVAHPGYQTQYRVLFTDD